MTVGDNVEYGLRVAGVERAEREQRAREALETVRLTGYGDRKPSELSGGQRQRVALARAIVNRPKVLLLDEPLGALDLKLREQMQIELKGIQGEVGITFIYVTHDQEEALTMSDRIAVFNRGQIEQVGTPAELYEQPGNRFVAGFVGVSNLLERDGARVHGPSREGTDARTGRGPGGHAHRARAGPGRRLRGDDHSLHRGARWRRRASGRAPEPRDLLRGGTRAEGARNSRGMAAGAHGRRFGNRHRRGRIK